MEINNLTADNQHSSFSLQIAMHFVVQFQFIAQFYTARTHFPERSCKHQIVHPWKQ